MSELVTGQNIAGRTAFTSASPVGNTPVGAKNDEQVFSDALEASRIARDTSQQSESLADNNEATEDRFLTLLVAQMQNQDPMNPLENAEVTTQLAQINTVRGVEELGQTARQLLAQSTNTNPATSSDVLDRHVLVKGNQLPVTESGENMTLGASINSATNSLTAQILDSDGQSVRQMLLGPQAAGVTTFDWDGKDNSGQAVEPGSYELVVQAAGPDGAAAVQSLVSRQVTGVTRGQDALEYRVQDGTNVSADDVLGIF